MRIQVHLATLAGKLPLAYRMGMVSLIKEALRQEDPEYFSKLYQTKNLKKPFSFAVFLKNFELNHDHFRVNEFAITISSGNHEFMLKLVNGLNLIQHFEIKGSPIKVVRVHVMREKSISEDSVVFQTLSPLLIESNLGPLSPAQEEYEKELNYEANLVVRNILNRSLRKHLQFMPLGMKKVVIKEQNRHFSKEGYLMFTAYKGLFRLKGDREDLQVLYENGIGRRSAQGFGLLEVKGV